jgi:3-methyladenine DNA glycosylase AlkC
MSAEFAVRHFIARYPNRMMVQMLQWADHPHEGVRRLSTEGCRPRLPWGIRLYDLIQDPSPILPILEKLKNDLSESVRRSVANNLNDISKDNSAVTLDVLKRWNAGAENNKEIQWITSHALRTLIKQGNGEALELLGYPADPQIDVFDVKVEPTRISIGERVTLTFKIRSTGNTSQNLMIDYLVYHMRANRQQTSKVFKIKKITLKLDQVLEIKKNHSFRSVTTRNYYTGPHGVQPQINGRVFDRVDFELTP